MAVKGRESGLDSAEHLAGDFARTLGVAQQVLALTMHELIALGQLVAGAVLQVVAQAPGPGVKPLGPAGAPKPG